MYILAIETSCDETSVSVSKNGVTILSNVIASSSNLFNETGGVVPEVAARKQVEYIIPVCNKALSEAKLDMLEIDYIAVAVGPGLIGSLFVGVDFAKTLSLIYKKPVIPINHLVGHIYSGFITNYLGKDTDTNVQFPLLSLVVSGGHTDLVFMESYKSIKYVGGTRDDAAGEAFDKVARLLNISKYLGGAALSKVAEGYNNKPTLKLPRPLINSNDFDFSFSGLKTAVLNEKDNFSKEEAAFEFEQSVIDVLLTKTKKAVDEYAPKTLIVCGGVSANKKLRETFYKEFGKKVIFPPFILSTDNAAMIACAAYFLKDNATGDLSKIKPNPSLSLENLQI
jgi:N6-L-threonylcarbamoyladenine synthase